MGGCTSKPKTTEYEALMDPQTKPGGDELGRKSIDSDVTSVDATRQSLDAVLKAIDRSNSAQKASERSLQTFFVKREHGDQSLEDNNSRALQEMLLDAADPKKQSIVDFKPEKEEEKIKSALEEQDDGKRDTKEKSAEEEPALKNAQEQVPSQKKLAVNLSTLSSNIEEDEVDKESAGADKIEPEDKNGPAELPKDSFEDPEKPSPNPELEQPTQESAEPILDDKASEVGVEDVKVVDNGQFKEEGCGCNPPRSSQAAEVDDVGDETHPEATTVEISHREEAAVKALVYQDEADAKIKPPEEESFQKESIVERTTPLHEETDNSARGENEPSAISEPGAMDMPEVVTPTEDADVGEDTVQVLGIDGKPAEFTSMGSVDIGGAPAESSCVTDSSMQATPSKANSDRSPIVIQVLGENPTPESSPTDSSIIATPPSTSQQDESPSSSLQTQGTDPEKSDAKVCESNPPLTIQKVSPENNGLPESEFVPVEVAAQDAASLSTLTTMVETDLNRTPIEFGPAPSHELQGSIYVDQGEKSQSSMVETDVNRISTEFPSQPLENSIIVDQEEMTCSQDNTTIEDLQDGETPDLQQQEMSTQKVFDESDQLPSMSDRVGHVPQGFQMDGSQDNSCKEVSGSSQPKSSLVVNAAIDKVLPRETGSIEAAKGGMRAEYYFSKDVPTRDIASSDIDQVLEKLASEFERQASVELGHKVNASNLQESTARLVPALLDSEKNSMHSR